MSHPGNEHPGRERGFILISAIWLLVLAGSIAALLLLYSIADTRRAVDDEQALLDRVALDGAAETLFASLVIDGERSLWLREPATPMSIGGRRITLSLSSENGRIDLNTAPLELIDSALRAFGADASDRQRLSNDLQALRTRKQRIASAAEMEALLGPDIRTRLPCPSDAFTIYSGLPAPDLARAPAPLRQALGTTTPEAPPALQAGSPIRGVLTTDSGLALTVVARLTGAQSRPLATTLRRFGSRCS